jgi:hypothetical protein
MKNENGHKDFDSISKLLRDQNAMLKVLLHHLSHAEATLSALTVKALSGQKLRSAKAMKDYLRPGIYNENDLRGGFLTLGSILS